MQLDAETLSQHQQIARYSCIPMSIEFVLKLLQRVPGDYYDLQRDWRNRTDGSFAAFDGRSIAGVRFRLQFGLARDDKFPFDDFFRTIESELAEGRYVIISLVVQVGWHIFVIHEGLPSGEFRAVSKIHGRTGTLVTEQVRAIVRQMKGTDILTYEIADARAA